MVGWAGSNRYVVIRVIKAERRGAAVDGRLPGAPNDVWRAVQLMPHVSGLFSLDCRLVACPMMDAQGLWRSEIRVSNPQGDGC